jgi:hypothetical protein
MIKTVQAKTADGVHFTANGTRGEIIHFDSSYDADPKARNPVVDIRDYRRFVNEGLIEKDPDTEEELAVASGDAPFYPAGTVVFASEDDFSNAVSAIVERRLAAMQDAEQSVDATTGLSHKALTAYPANQPVGNVEEGCAEVDENEIPPAPNTMGDTFRRGRGRPRKASADDMSMLDARPPVSKVDGEQQVELDAEGNPVVKDPPES